MKYFMGITFQPTQKWGGEGQTKKKKNPQKLNTKKYLVHHILRLIQAFLQGFHNYSYNTRE